MTISPEITNAKSAITSNNSKKDKRKILLAGNPNCGKTTIFNALTGSNYKVANYPGVTVEKKEGQINLPNHANSTLVDLPGIYSLSGHSIDEAIAAKELLGQIKNEEWPDLIVSVVDATNLERNLYLTSQLLDLGVPLILVLNMIDLAEKDGLSIKYEILSRLLDVPVVAISASKGRGIEQLIGNMDNVLSSPKFSSKRYAWLEPDSEYAKCSEELGKSEINSQNNSRNQLSVLIGSGLLADAYSPSNEIVKEALDKGREELRLKGIDYLSFEATKRYQLIHEIVGKSCVIEREDSRRFNERIDNFITHKIWGTLTFLIIMAFIFQSIFLWASYPMDLIDGFFQRLGSWAGEIIPEGQIRSLVVDGVISGVGSVVIFIPQIALLFFFLGLLEDSGYLTRAAFLMDRIMRKVGLQGRSFIPLLSSFACAIPGIMSTRTIPSFGDRMATILIAPLMSCSARLPVYALLIAAFVPDTKILGIFSIQGLVLLSMYLLGVIGAVFVAWILRVSVFRGEPAIFVMEMPRFRVPMFGVVLRDVIDRVVIFIKGAGTVILACSIILWFLASYPRGPIEETFAGKIGKAMEPVIHPIGFNWEIGIGILASFAAREVFISSLSTVYNLENDDEENSTLLQTLHAKRASGEFTMASALSLMVFYVFACQCMSTLAVCRRETGSWKWPAFMFIYMTALAYLASFITYKAALNWSL